MWRVSSFYLVNPSAVLVSVSHLFIYPRWKHILSKRWIIFCVLFLFFVSMSCLLLVNTFAWFFNIWTVSKAAMGKLPRDGVWAHMGFVERVNTVLDRSELIKYQCLHVSMGLSDWTAALSTGTQAVVKGRVIWLDAVSFILFIYAIT